uniref:Alpha-ketoglutarate-dependent dioxygenase alkB n=1 Tax=Aegilops tauschii TaxID=37682 RepID=M8BZ07_AEGTA
MYPRITQRTDIEIKTRSKTKKPHLQKGSRGGPERSLESQKEGLCSSSPSVSSTESTLQMVIPGLLKSLDSPVQPPKSLDSPLQTVKQVQPRKSLDSLVQMVGSMQLSKSTESKSASSGSGAAGSDLGAAPFDICMGNSKGTVILKHGLLEINREKRRAKELSDIAPVQHLRPGMVKIIKHCRDLGVGPGGFYQPGYREGAKLSLRMMCLGKNWDPDSGSYGDIRRFDAAQPPKIPEELTKYVKDAIAASHEFLKQRGKGATNPDAELPVMSPDICIVNFYTTSGKLGFHQDNNEQRSSLARGLPVVSFSLGDTAEFLYGDVRDDDKASKIKLESGDVLIFGGQSRHIFHGVSSIAPKSAPLWVTDKANLRPGRLNLTFRQYNYKGSVNVTPAPFDTCVEIFKLCHNLGVNARECLCLGKKCNQYSNSYGDMRPFDGAQPDIPEIFKKLVEDAIEASHEFLEQRRGTSNALVELPPMSPDMCTVRFDTIIPTIVLRQDTDVTETSLARELPVVSFWLGDSAEFLYPGIRDDVASKIDLESGDVLIFGSQSRRISHAVSSIKPRTAPMWLVDKTDLQAGLLNLTFRQYYHV